MNCCCIKKHDNGFTMVELIVVLAILSILATMLIPALTG
ncbi:MAG: type II secretion system protein, partial [Erysipelotrichaceae bacterium]